MTAFEGRVEAIEALIAAGADIDPASNDGMTAIGLATRNRRTDSLIVDATDSFPLSTRAVS